MNPYQPGEDNQDPYEVGYKAGAASRDAEVDDLKCRLVELSGLASGYVAEREQLRKELETEQMRNVACGVVAMADTPDSAKQARDMHPDYMSASCLGVARRVDECIKLREDVRKLRDAINEALDTYKIPRTARICEVLAATEPR